jgi:transposase-like protein
LGYSFKSFTIDGKKGLKEYLQMTYPSAPVQYCQFHQKQTIRQCITLHLKTECGQELKALTDKLCEYDYDGFREAYAALKHRWEYYLKERNEHKEFKHIKLCRAFRSLKSNLPNLFTYKHFERLKIPSTTNSCEGYFGQLKSKVRVHWGLRLINKIKLIETLLNGTY